MTFISPSTGAAVKAVLFDTFGTVVDWRSGVSAHCADFFGEHNIKLDPIQFALDWRALYEPSMEPVRSGERQYTPLDVLHRENLVHALREAGVDVALLPGSQLDDLARAWERLSPWPDSVPGLAQLARGFLVGPLSNANTALLLAMAEHASLPWGVVLGSDAIRAYKPSPDAYRNMASMLRLKPAEVMLAAAHNYDLAAAQRAGLATAFVARRTEFGPDQRIDLQAEGDWDVNAESIPELAGVLLK